MELLDPERRLADCCSEGFVRTTYDFKNGYFVQRGAQEFGNIEVSGPKRPKVTAVAARHRLPVRYVQRLFEAEAGAV